MRRLVEPLPSMHCELCGGELLLKRVEPVNLLLEIDVPLRKMWTRAVT
jgi:hypothetical protein